MFDFDSAWKEAIDALFDSFMAFFFPSAHAEIDWARGFEMLDKELQQITPDAEQGRRFADKLVKVWRTDGEEEWALIHVEFQSQREKEFAKRMFVYNYRLFDRYNRIVASFAILGDNKTGWRPNRFGYELWGTKIGIEFATAKLLDYSDYAARLELNANPFAVVVQAHLKTFETAHDDESRRVWQVRLIKGLYDRGFNAEQIRQLYRIIDQMMALPAPLAAIAWQEIQDFEQEKQMPYITTAERVGIEKGLAEGLAKGRQEGLLTGIEALLESKFATAGLALMGEIRCLQDVALLEKILDAAKTATSPEAICQLWRDRH